MKKVKWCRGGEITITQGCLYMLHRFRGRHFGLRNRLICAFYALLVWSSARDNLITTYSGLRKLAYRLLLENLS
jgi:hypothetical protein